MAAPVFRDAKAIKQRKYFSFIKKIRKCATILVNLLKMRPHYSQSSHKNVTPSSGTSPLTSYKEVAPHNTFASGKIIDAIEQAIIYVIGGNQQ